MSNWSYLSFIPHYAKWLILYDMLLWYFICHTVSESLMTPPVPSTMCNPKKHPRPPCDDTWTRLFRSGILWPSSCVLLLLGSRRFGGLETSALSLETFLSVYLLPSACISPTSLLNRSIIPSIQLNSDSPGPKSCDGRTRQQFLGRSLFWKADEPLEMRWASSLA